jgi:geranylgeranyl diphosphate synthase type I
LTTQESALDVVARHMADAFDRHAGEWTENPVAVAIRHTLSGRGKMVRAAILLEACRAVGGDADLLTPAATGIEYGHLASLVHDDLIDGDTVRRDRGTVWHEFGATNAIVAGDLLVFAAFHALAACRARLPADRIVRALETVTEAGIETCFGEALELALTGDVTVPAARYVRMARAKTGSLVRGAAEGGAILGGGSAAQVAALRDYGERLGLAFQLVDDLLPYVSDAETLGKPVHSDLRNRRATLPVIYALERCGPGDRRLLLAAFSRPGLVEVDMAELHRAVAGVLERTDALGRTRRLAAEHCHAALGSLAPLAANEGVAHLEGLALRALARNR